ncbi:MAG TPA: tyrosine-type recombinase/integrase [Vicinamibacterales bacterium]
MRPASTMQALVDTYLAARRSMGFDLRIDGRQLCAFARFAARTGHRGPLTVAVAVSWAQSAPRGTRLTWARRLQTLRPFMKYRAQFDPGTEIAPSGLFGPAHRRLVPHIYTDAEVTALVNAAAQLRPVTGLRLRARTYATLFGLLASTGLRISEALALAPADVDLPGVLLTVRNTKFRKSRIVPLHPTTAAALQRYVDARRRRVSDRRIATFLVSDQGTALGDRMVHHTFATLRARLGWIGRGGYAVPRIHDLRHTFLCRALVRSYQQHEVDHVIDVLSTYVGHARVSDTYWYITAVPELLALAAERFAPQGEGGAL